MAGSKAAGCLRSAAVPAMHVVVCLAIRGYRVEGVDLDEVVLGSLRQYLPQLGSMDGSGRSFILVA